MQKPVQQFTSECQRSRILVDSDMPIGVFHDFLMMVKGMMVDRMVAAHQQQVEEAKLLMQDEPPEENKEEVIDAK